MLTLYFWITLCGYLVTLLLIPVLLLQKKRPVSTVAWLFLIVLAPYFGALFYVVFGVNRVQRRVVRKTVSDREIARLLPELTHYQLLPGEGLTAKQQNIVRLISRLSSTRARSTAADH